MTQNMIIPCYFLKSVPQIPKLTVLWIYGSEKCSRVFRPLTQLCGKSVEGRGFKDVPEQVSQSSFLEIFQIFIRSPWEVMFRHRMDFPKQKVQLLLSLRLDWDKLVCSWWDCSDVAGLVYPEAAKQRRWGRERPARKFSIGGLERQQSGQPMSLEGGLPDQRGAELWTKRGANQSPALGSALRVVVTSGRFVQ